MGKLSRRFGKYENTLFYADYGAAFFNWLFVGCLIIGIIYLKFFTP